MTNMFLKDRRVELGLSQLEVANYVGVSESTVSRWERGDIANMRRDRMSKLAKILKVDPKILLGDVDSVNTTHSSAKSGVINEIMSRLDQLPVEQLSEALRYLDYLVSRSENP